MGRTQHAAPLLVGQPMVLDRPPDAPGKMPDTRAV
jgi:hypothetical protein